MRGSPRSRPPGLDTMFNADYAGSHWISSFAVKYLVEVGREDDP